MPRDERLRSEMRRQNPVYREAQKRRYKLWAEKHPPTPEKRRLVADRQHTYRNDPAKRHKHVARWKVRHAVVAGRIEKQACANCGNANTQAHHPDYDRPLDVIWLCPPCHRLEHTKAQAGE